MGEGAVEAIIEARKKPFRSFYDFVAQLDLKRVNKRVFEALISSGACECFGEDKATLMASLATALSLAEKKSIEKNHKQGSLFALLEDKPDIAYIKAQPWNLRQALQAEKK